MRIDDEFHLSEFGWQDKAALIEHLKEKQIYLQTLAIPFPYTESDADWWINRNIEAAKRQQGRTLNWAIRRSSDGLLIGGVGFSDHKIGTVHSSELGYWLAKPYWGKGIMTEVVKVVTAFGFKELGLIRITAHIFAFNKGSARVLEKAGFLCEGHLRSHYQKEGQIIDAKIYGLLSDENIVRPQLSPK